MGLLKHFLLPAFGLLHLVQVRSCLDLNSWGEMVGHPVTEAVDLESARQLHMLGGLKAFNVAMAVLCFLSTVGHDSSAQARGMMILAECIFYTIDAIDGYQLGIESYTLAAGLAGIALVGVIVHSQEPGLFTQDKTKAKKK